MHWAASTYLHVHLRLSMRCGRCTTCIIFTGEQLQLASSASSFAIFNYYFNLASFSQQQHHCHPCLSSTRVVRATIVTHLLESKPSVSRPPIIAYSYFHCMHKKKTLSLELSQHYCLSFLDDHFRPPLPGLELLTRGETDCSSRSR